MQANKDEVVKTEKQGQRYKHMATHE